MKAAIYCRVSTDNQEAEGTSLQTQLEACRNHCQGKGNEVAYCFSEAFSGLTLDRPKLNELRELVRAGNIDVVVVYCLDRLSRDPTHGVILQEEMEKYHINLEAVIEDVDNSELGKLISYIRGFASKLEAEKIKERTMRGKKAKAKLGQIPGGGFARTYGYDYIKKSDNNGGRRVINETEAKWARQIYHWLVADGMSTTSIMNRLRALSAPTKSGGFWTKQTVLSILKNPAYMGRTYAFMMTHGKAKYSQPREDWIEIPGVTPAIIDEASFEAAQRQLQANSRKATRNAKRQYLLHGHVYCRRCGRTYWSYFNSKYVKGKRYEKRRYRCSGSMKVVQPLDHCQNKGWAADRLETLTWNEIGRLLDNPELIIAELNEQRQGVGQIKNQEAELHQIEKQLRALDRDQEQLLGWALKGFPEDAVIKENIKINNRRENLKMQKSELEAQIRASQEASISLPKLEEFVEVLREKLTTLDYEPKRLALDMLNIKVWIDGHHVEITGTIPMPEHDIATIQS